MIFSLFILAVVLVFAWLIWWEYRASHPKEPVRMDGLYPRMPDDVEFFKCPSCGHPAEINNYVDTVENGRTTTYIVIACLMNHDMIRVTQQWFEENISK